jgi:hypothetical protein
MGVLLAVREWLKKGWMWIALAAALVLAFLAGRYKKPTPSSDPIRDNAEKKADEKIKQVEEEHQKQIDAATKGHDQQVEKIIEDAEKNVEKEKDPQELDDFLKDVGKKVRDSRG